MDVRGHLFERDFPEVVAEMARRKGELGMSYEIADVRVVDVDAAAPIVGVASVVRIVAAVVASGDPIAEPPTMGIIGNIERVAKPMLDGFRSLGTSTPIASSRSSSAQIADVDQVRFCAARTLDSDTRNPAGILPLDINDRKLVEPVTRARERMFG